MPKDPCAKCDHEAHRHDRDEDTEICLECCKDHSSEAFKTRYHSFMPDYADLPEAELKPERQIRYDLNRYEVEEF